MKYLTTEKVPEWAIPYMEYGDECSYGLTDEEIKMCDDFIASYGGGLVFNYIDIDNPYFSTVPAFGEPTTVVDTEIYKA